MPITAKIKWFDLSVSIVDDRAHHPAPADDLAFCVESQYGIDVGGGHLHVGISEAPGISSKFGHQIPDACHWPYLQIEELPRSDRLIIDSAPLAADSTDALVNMSAATELHRHRDLGVDLQGVDGFVGVDLFNPSNSSSSCCYWYGDKDCEHHRQDDSTMRTANS